MSSHANTSDQLFSRKKMQNHAPFVVIYVLSTILKYYYRMRSGDYGSRKKWAVGGYIDTCKSFQGGEESMSSVATLMAVNNEHQ